MRALVCYSGGNPKLKELAEGFARGLKGQGHTADLMEIGTSQGGRPVSMGIYDFLAVGTVSLGFLGGKIPGEVPLFIDKVTRLEGKKSAVFMPAGGFGTAKSLTALMKAVEKQGAIVLDFAALGNAKEAEEFAGRMKMG